MLIVPEGDSSDRSHAHSECVLAARTAGRLPTRDEWERSTGQHPPRLRERLARLLKRQ
jgi:hypothetical protein